MTLLKNKYFLISLVAAYFVKDYVREQINQEDGLFSSKYQHMYGYAVEVLGLGTVLYMIAKTLKIAKR